MDVGLRLHNLEHFDLALKLGCPKRLLESESNRLFTQHFWIYKMYLSLALTKLIESEMQSIIPSGLTSSKVLILCLKQISLFIEMSSMKPRFGLILILIPISSNHGMTKALGKSMT